MKARREPVDVSDVAASAIERASKARPSRKIELTIAPNEAPAEADTALLEQVLVNLLDNADKYSLPGTATRMTVSGNGDKISIAVTDEGIGIPKEALTRVFDKFYRVAGSDGRAPGTGLGLSICAGLVRAMGGNIRAESPVKDDRGTRIVLELKSVTAMGAET